LLAAGLITTGWASTWSGLWISGLVFGVGAALVEPSFRAELSRAAERFQGEAQGLNSAVQSLARVVAFKGFLTLFSAFSPEVAFAGAGSLAVLAALLASLSLRAPAEEIRFARSLEEEGQLPPS
jgi:hypothetical protein